MPKVSRLDQPEFAMVVAEAYMNGLSRPEMAAEFDCHVDTITEWTKDPRVTVHASKAAQERIHRIGRRIDTIIEGRLQEAKDMDTDTLLKIRKEYLDRPLKIMLGEIDKNPESIADSMAFLEDNPELAAALFGAMADNQKELPAPVDATFEEMP